MALRFMLARTRIIIPATAALRPPPPSGQRLHRTTTSLAGLLAALRSPAPAASPIRGLAALSGHQHLSGERCRNPIPISHKGCSSVGTTCFLERFGLAQKKACYSSSANSPQERSKSSLWEKFKFRWDEDTREMVIMAAAIFAGVLVLGMMCYMMWYVVAFFVIMAALVVFLLILLQVEEEKRSKILEDNADDDGSKDSKEKPSKN